MHTDTPGMKISGKSVDNWVENWGVQTEAIDGGCDSTWRLTHPKGRIHQTIPVLEIFPRANFKLALF